MFKIEVQKQYTVILENYYGDCKRVKILAFTADEAFAKGSAYDGWVVVGVE